MDLEKADKAEDTLANDAQHIFQEEADYGEENISSVSAQMNKDEEFVEKEPSDIHYKAESSCGDIPKVMINEKDSESSHCEHPGQASTKKNENPLRTGEILDFVHNVKSNTQLDESGGKFIPKQSQNEIPEQKEETPNKVSEPTKPIIESSATGEICDGNLHSDESESEYPKLEKVSDTHEKLNSVLTGDKKLDCEISIHSPKADSEIITKVTSDPHEWGDSVEVNKSEEETLIQRVEVIGLKTSADVETKPPEQENVEEIKGNDSQRPRSHSYPFKVLVSGLPLNARRDDVMSYFQQFGEVLKLWNEGRHRYNVLFSDEDSFKNAIFTTDPYFDDHKLLIRSQNETTAVIAGIPRTTPVKDAENCIKSVLKEAGFPLYRIVVPISDSNESTEGEVIQGHAFIVFSDSQTLQKVENLQETKPFVMANSRITLYSSSNKFYEKFCIRLYPLPAEHPRAVLYHNIQNTFAEIGKIVSIFNQYVVKGNAYAGYILFESEDCVKTAKEKNEVTILGQLVEIQDFHPFEQGQGFRHLWLKILNLPLKITITEIKHHFGHDKEILNVELDLDFGSCFMHVNSEQTMLKFLKLHQTYLRGKCIAVMITEEHPDRSYYREVSRRRRNKPFNRNTGGWKKGVAKSSSSGFNGKTYTSTA